MPRRSRKEKKDKKEDIFTDPNEPKRNITFQIIPYLGLEFCLVFIGVIGAMGMGITPVLLYKLLGEMINLMAGSVAQSSSEIVKGAAGILALANIGDKLTELAKKMSYIAVGACVAGFIQFFFMNFAHGLVGTRLKMNYFYNLLDQEIGYFDMKRTGELLNGMTESMEIIQEGHTNKIGELVQNLTQSVFGLIMALVTGWKMALVMLSVMPLFILLLFVTGMTIGVVQRIVNKMNGKAAGIANEVVSSMRTIRSMDGEEREKKRFNKQILTLHTPFLVRGMVSGMCVGLAIFVNWGNIALGFWWGGKLMRRGELNFSDLFMVFGFTLMAVLGIAQALRILPEFAKTTQSIKDLLKIIKRVPILRPSGGIQPEKIEGNITFNNVYFSYPTRPNVQVLKNFSLTITPGQAVALVGASGSGKSTIVGLLEKFYEQESGTITLDGVDLKEIDPRWLHRNIGIVTQEPTLFATTITENILYAVKYTGKTYTQEDVENAAKAANAHDFITALPDGYNTILGERGVSMSGGQKQRIAIARAMIQDPKVLLLDEATSALDTQSESIVQDALNKLMKGRTSIVIAHRLSTIVDSDVICVMNKGELKEKGTHKDLLKIENGYYYKLAAKQMLFGNNESQNESSTSIDIHDEL